MHLRERRSIDLPPLLVNGAGGNRRAGGGRGGARLGAAGRGGGAAFDRGVAAVYTDRMPRRRECRAARETQPAGGGPYYAHPDWEGSWRLASSPSRAATGELAYSPYGATYAGSGPDAFTGQWVDTPDNLNDFQHRLLAPMMGRWLSPDPAGIAAVNFSDPQSWNEYAYVGDQPLEATDPTGLLCTPGNCPWSMGAADFMLALPDGFGGVIAPPPLSPTMILGFGGGGGGGTGAGAPPTTNSPRGPACVSAGQINALLSGTPLAGQGQNFYSAGKRYDVNPALAVGIAAAESSLGRNVNATWGFHNAWGWGATQPYRAEAQGWTSWQPGIYTVTAQLADRLYMGASPPLDTTAAIYGKWCQSGTCAAGLATINQVLGELGVSPDSLRFKACGGNRQ